MILGIDATNIIKGGGITHLKEILNFPEEFELYFDKIYIWSNAKTLDIIPDHPLYLKKHHPVFEKSIFKRIIWRKFFFTKILNEFKVDLLFMPGGPSGVKFAPKVTMSRNMHPYVWKELLRYSFLTFFFYKYLLIRLFQPSSFKKFDAIIFLNEFVKNYMIKLISKYKGKTEIIAHGINSSFFYDGRQFKPISEYTISNKFKILYVSKIDVHKHQSKVAKAILELFQEGYPIEITFIGSIDDKRSYNILNKQIEHDKNGILKYLDDINHNDLYKFYNQSDLFVFASSCENLPNILLEAMSNKIPIACSSTSPMPEILKDGGTYFNPESVTEIKLAVKSLLESVELRKKVSERSFEISSTYSWKKCAAATAFFLHKSILTQ
jgi:glycosyltransferase involved in cell wall biosynthesis